MFSVYHTITTLKAADLLWHEQICVLLRMLSWLPRHIPAPPVIMHVHNMINYHNYKQYPVELARVCGAS